MKTPKILVIAPLALTVLFACSSKPKGDEKAGAAPAADTPVKARAKPSPESFRELEAALFASPSEAKLPLFCGYYSSTCEGSASTSRMALVTRSGGGLAIDLVMHDDSSTEKKPKRFTPSGDGFVSRDDSDLVVDFRSTCRSSLKPSESCTLTLVDRQTNEPLFRGLCSTRGAREFFKPCGDGREATSGLRKAKLTYANKTYELPLVAQGSSPRLTPPTASEGDLAKVKKAIVGLKVGDLPGWLKTGGWEEAFPPIGNRWARDGYSALAATYPTGELIYLLAQPASRYDNLVVRDVAFAPKGTVRAWDGRDCDQEGMAIGFQTGGEPSLTLEMTGLFIDSRNGRFELRPGLKASCR